MSVKVARAGSVRLEPEEADGTHDPGNGNEIEQEETEATEAGFLHSEENRDRRSKLDRDGSDGWDVVREDGLAARGRC
jgi:hypothetical protein